MFKTDAFKYSKTGLNRHLRLFKGQPVYKGHFAQSQFAIHAYMNLY